MSMYKSGPFYWKKSNDSNYTRHLVDQDDRPTGTLEKTGCPSTWVAPSGILGFYLQTDWKMGPPERQWEILLQQRAAGKYHTPASGPIPAVPTPNLKKAVCRLPQKKDAAGRDGGCRHPFPMPAGFIMLPPVGNSLTENENDHVFTGIHFPKNTSIKPNQDEVRAWRWIALSDLTDELISTQNSLHPGLLKRGTCP